MEESMYCPTCGAQSTENLRFCRSCGTDLGVVSQALTGNLAPTNPQRSLDTRRERRHRGHDEDETPRIDGAVTKIFGGLGFICVAAAVFFFAPAGKIWFWAMLIPGFMSLGRGIGEYLRYNELSKAVPEAQTGPQLQPPQQTPQYLSPPPSTGRFDTPHSFETSPPPSVTEDTTRHLDAAGQAPQREPER
jgi:hypothetical protein